MDDNLNINVLNLLQKKDITNKKWYRRFCN